MEWNGFKMVRKATGGLTLLLHFKNSAAASGGFCILSPNRQCGLCSFCVASAVMLVNYFTRRMLSSFLQGGGFSWGGGDRDGKEDLRAE